MFKQNISLKIIILLFIAGALYLAFSGHPAPFVHIAFGLVVSAVLYLNNKVYSFRTLMFVIFSSPIMLVFMYAPEYGLHFALITILLSAVVIILAAQFGHRLDFFLKEPEENILDFIKSWADYNLEPDVILSLYIYDTGYVEVAARDKKEEKLNHLNHILQNMLCAKATPQYLKAYKLNDSFSTAGLRKIFTEIKGTHKIHTTGTISAHQKIKMLKKYPLFLSGKGV